MLSFSLTLTMLRTSGNAQHYTVCSFTAQCTIHTYPEFLLPFWGHEALLGLLGLGGFLHALAHLGALALDLSLFSLLSLQTETDTQMSISIAFVIVIVIIIGLVIEIEHVDGTRR